MVATPPEESLDEITALRNVSIFGALANETIHFLRERCETVAVAAGDPFFRQGEMGDAVYVLRQGRAAVLRTMGEACVPIAEVEAGLCFGEMALIGIQPRNATVTAITDCVALKLRNLRLLDLFQEDPEQFTLIQMNLGREVARRLAVANETICTYARRLGEARPEAEVLARVAETVK